MTGERDEEGIFPIPRRVVRNVLRGAENSSMQFVVEADMDVPKEQPVLDKLLTDLCRINHGHLYDTWRDGEYFRDGVMFTLKMLQQRLEEKGIPMPVLTEAQGRAYFQFSATGRGGEGYTPHGRFFQRFVPQFRRQEPNLTRTLTDLSRYRANDLTYSGVDCYYPLRWALLPNEAPYQVPV